MTKYSFLLQDEETEYALITPRIRLLKLGCWGVGESIQYEKAVKEQAKHTLTVHALAKKIAVDKGITVDEALELLNHQEEQENAILLADYVTDVTSIMNAGSSRLQQNAKLAGIFIRSRGQGLGKKNEWDRLGDWSEGDTEMLNEEQLDKVIEFIVDERRGTVEEEEDFEPPAEEEGAGGNESQAGSESSENVVASSKPKTSGTKSSSDSLPQE